MTKKQYNIETLNNTEVKKDQRITDAMTTLVALGLTKVEKDAANEQVIARLTEGKTALAYHGKDIVSFMIYFTLSTSAYEFGVMTHPKHRGQGLYTELMQNGKTVMPEHQYQVATTSNFRIIEKFLQLHQENMICPVLLKNEGQTTFQNIDADNLDIVGNIAILKQAEVSAKGVITGNYPPGGLYKTNINKDSGYELDSTTGDGVLLIAKQK